MRTRAITRSWLAFAVLAGLAGTVSGQDKSYTPGIEEQLAAMRKAMQKQQEELVALRMQIGAATGGREAIEAQRAMIASMIRAETSKLAEAWDWVDNWNLSGDFRYRHEWIKDGRQADDRNPRNRDRIRLRLFLTGRVNDEMMVTTSLVTGSNDPVSTNQTLGDDGGGGTRDWFQTKSIMLDLAYLAWKPKACGGLTVTAGKIPNPFYRVNKMDMIWDGDLTFEGIAFNHSLKAGEAVTLYANGGGFWLHEQRYNAAHRTRNDTALWGVQGYAKVDLKELLQKGYVIAGVSYYDYANVEDFPRSVGAGSAGNTVAGGDNHYVMDYNIVNPFVEVGFDAFGLPVKVYGDIAVNTVAKSQPTISGGNDFAWLVGFQVGAAKKKGQWELKYDYRDVQPDALIGAFTDSDSFEGGTNGKGHRVGVAYGLADNVTVGATYFCDRTNAYSRNADEAFYHRLQLDLVVKF